MPDYDRWHDNCRADRDDWRIRHQVNPWHDPVVIRSYDRWADRYDRWYDGCRRPDPIIVRVPVRVEIPLPDPDIWSYLDIESVAVDMEGITRDVYETMSQVTPSNPNREYAERLMGVLADLEWAAENYTDAVYNGTDYVDSLDDLFYLESELTLTEQTLDGYSKQYLVDDQVRTLRYDVDQLLWQYRQNY